MISSSSSPPLSPPVADDAAAAIDSCLARSGLKSICHPNSSTFTESRCHGQCSRHRCPPAPQARCPQMQRRQKGASASLPSVSRLAIEQNRARFSAGRHRSGFDFYCQRRRAGAAPAPRVPWLPRGVRLSRRPHRVPHCRRLAGAAAAVAGTNRAHFGVLAASVMRLALIDR